MGKQVIQTRPSLGLFLLKWITVIAWRFFVSGRHLSGKTFNDSTWLHDASIRHKRMNNRSYTWWRRKAGWKRALWRNSIFWPIFWIIYGFVFWSLDYMSLIMFWVLVVLCWYGFYPMRRLLFEYHRAGYSDGQVEGYWVLKWKIRRRFAWMASDTETQVRSKADEMDEDENERQDIPMIGLRLLIEPEEPDEPE